ncbi:MAG: hypothetical protein CVT48_05260 [Thermoplasmata archaeon HGW-Thermoplasmata-1]|nr:MAG: hypothetical protein CVT48_05260 [Thermoplasmata archaeon HGW-Thermoplasmata-1]
MEKRIKTGKATLPHCDPAESGERRDQPNRAEGERRHAPSAYRALSKRVKTGGERIEELLAKARELGDPYYTALAILGISLDPRLRADSRDKLEAEAIECAACVEALWRRGEVIAAMAKSAGKNNRIFGKRIIGLLLDMPAGKGLSDAISACAPYADSEGQTALLNMALDNRGFELGDAKAVLKHWDCKKEGVDALVAMLVPHPDASLKARLLGYIFIQCKRLGVPGGDLFFAASSAAAESGDSETFRYLADNAGDEAEFRKLACGATNMNDCVEKADALTSIASRADRAGFTDVAKTLFESAVRIAEGIYADDKRQGAAKRLAVALERFGQKEEADKMSQIAASAVMPKPAAAAYEKGAQASVPAAPSTQHDKKNHLLALYDTYEGGIKPIHLRAIARAAPLCFAFDLDLALMGFPSQDLPSLIEQTITETRIGRGGHYLRQLAAEGRILLVPCTQNRPPEDWSLLGLPVATTSKPDEAKRVGMQESLAIAAGDHSLGRACIIMGLGRKGLPKSIIDFAPRHLELTGVDVPLETCTVMGIIAQQIRCAMHGRHKA